MASSQYLLHDAAAEEDLGFSLSAAHSKAQEQLLLEGNSVLITPGATHQQGHAQAYCRAVYHTPDVCQSHVLSASGACQNVFFMICLCEGLRLGAGLLKAENASLKDKGSGLKALVQAAGGLLVDRYQSY